MAQNPITPAENPTRVLPFPPVEAAAADWVLPLHEALRAKNDVLHVGLGEEDGPAAIVIGHPHDIHRVLTDPNFLIKGLPYNGVRRVLGDGVLTTYGQEWAKNNRIVRPPFHRLQVAQAIGMIADTGREFAARLRERAGEIIDIKEEMTVLAFNTITTFLFGEHAPTVRERLTYDDLLATFAATAQIGGELSPEQERQITETTNMLTTLIDELIPKAREEDPNGTLLSILAHATDSETGGYLKNKTIRDELVTFLFAGHESSAITLTWWQELTRNHPYVIRKMREEAIAAFQGDNTDASILDRLPYSRQIFNEVLRARPPAHMFSRQVEKETEIRGVTIRPQDILAVSIWAAHHHPDFWESPEKFDPNRFAPGAKPYDRHAYIPFASGSRVCTGKHFALAEAPILAGVLLKDIDFELMPESEPAGLKASITLQPRRPVRARIQPI